MGATQLTSSELLRPTNDQIKSRAVPNSGYYMRREGRQWLSACLQENPHPADHVSTTHG